MRVVDEGYPSLLTVGTSGSCSVSSWICSFRISGLGWSVLGGGKGVWGVMSDSKPLRLSVEAVRDGGILDRSFHAVLD